MGKQSHITVQSKDTACTIKLAPPPWSAFAQLLVDPDDDHNLKRLLAKYRNPERQCRLLLQLQYTRHLHRASKSVAECATKNRRWFNKRKTWCRQVANLDVGLAALLGPFQDGPLYPALLAGNKLLTEYDREVARVVKAIQELQHAVTSSAILSNKFTRRGHQPEPYIDEGIQALRRLGIGEADANAFLILIGVKIDLHPTSPK